MLFGTMINIQNILWALSKILTLSVLKKDNIHFNEKNIVSADDLVPGHQVIIRHDTYRLPSN